MKPGSTVAFRAVLEGFREEGWTLIGDLAAGTRQPFFGWSDFAEVVLVVADPSAKALLTARRLARLAERPAGEQADDGHGAAEQPPALVGLVANKVRAADDLGRIEEALAGARLPLMATVPYDEGLAKAERLGHAPIDAALSAPAVGAIEELASRLEHLDAGRGKGIGPQGGGR